MPIDCRQQPSAPTSTETAKKRRSMPGFRRTCPSRSSRRCWRRRSHRSFIALPPRDVWASGSIEASRGRLKRPVTDKKRVSHNHRRLRAGEHASDRNTAETVKIKLDENLPNRLVAVFTRLGHDVDTVHAEHLIGRADSDVWSAVQAAQRFLITQDLDFSDMPSSRPVLTPVSFLCS